MAQKPLSILISGAGVAGGSLALMLARNPSFKVKPIITLLERSPSPRATGQAIDIRGPGVDVIRQLGLEPTIKAHHTSETGFAFINDQGGVITKMDATGDAKKQSITSEYEILRSDLVNLFMEGVQAEKEKGANVNVVYGESIASLEDTPSGVDVTFKNNTLPQQKFDVVLGADGSSSKTRALVFGTENNYKKPSGMYIAFFTVPRIPSDDDLYRLCILPGGLSMHMRPHRNKTTMGVYLSIMNTKAAPISEIDHILRGDADTQKTYFAERFAGTGWQSERFTKAVLEADDFYATHWCQVRTPKWTANRVALLGDAAAATMGIGTSLAITSAYIIAGELGKIASPADVPAALANYEKIFRPYFAKHEKMHVSLAALFPQSKWGVGMLQWVVKVLVGLRVVQVATWAFGGDKDGWTLPDYGWEDLSATEVK